MPNSPELHLAPLAFGGPNDALVSGPNPRTISNVIAGGTGSGGVNGQTTDPTLSAWLYAFGQFVDHDLDLEQTLSTSTPINIAIPPGDPYFPDGTVISMTRDTRDPATNTIVNTVTGVLDLSQLYGSDQATASSLQNSDGTLASSGNGLYLPVVNDAFVSGDVRVMENPELTAITTMFMREHNFWVGALKNQHPNWNGTLLYNMARAITTAEYQNIVYTEYVPHLAGRLAPYAGYTGVNPQITQEFSTAAFRVGHSQVSDTQEGLDNSGNTVFTESLAQSFFNTPEIDEANGIDPLLRSLGVDFAQATDPFVVAALRDLLSATPDQMDLIAIDVNRERDVGIATLNATRRALGLAPYASFAQLTPDPATQALYASIYGSIENVDLFMGGLAERHAFGGVVGETFGAVIRDQFERLRAGDRYFWQNQGFDPRTQAMIAGTTLATLMKRDTATTAGLQPDLFVQGNLSSAPHQPPHALPPASVDTHGRRPVFHGDGP